MGALSLQIRHGVCSNPPSVELRETPERSSLTGPVIHSWFLAERAQYRRARPTATTQTLALRQCCRVRHDASASPVRNADRWSSPVRKKECSPPKCPSSSSSAWRGSREGLLPRVGLRKGEVTKLKCYPCRLLSSKAAAASRGEPRRARTSLRLDLVGQKLKELGDFRMTIGSLIRDHLHTEILPQALSQHRVSWDRHERVVGSAQVLERLALIF